MKYEDDWAPYFCKVNDVVASIFVNLGIKKIAPDKTRPELLWVWVSMNSIREDGFPQNDEFENLNKIENELINVLEKKQKAIHVGSVTTAGRREFYFFSKNAKNFDLNLKLAMSKFPNYKFESGNKTDSSWVQYFDFLYPRPQQYQSIQNMKVVQQLENAGDNAEKERNVMHWIYFKSSINRDEFISKVNTLGFKIKPDYMNFKAGEDYPYSVVIERTDKVEFNYIDSIIIDLWKMAKEFNGDYDGWETSIEK